MSKENKLGAAIVAIVFVYAASVATVVFAVYLFSFDALFPVAAVVSVVVLTR